MKTEPYICIKGLHAGEIQWMFKHPDGRLIDLLPRHNSADLQFIRYGGDWQPYADFEREKLTALNMTLWLTYEGYGLDFDPDFGSKYKARDLINYSQREYDLDSESSRLLKRAEFIKAVCEKEGVEWLPKGKCNACNCCLCPCHR